MSWNCFVPRPTVAENRARAEREIARRMAMGEIVSPVIADGSRFGKTFWGRAWCDQVKQFSDRGSRLSSGRTFVRQRAVIDLKISPGQAKAIVIGDSVYPVKIRVDPIAPKAWQQIKKELSGEIGSVVELLRGRLSTAVMSVVTRPGGGLLPAPEQMHITCGCYDWTICKHAAAALFGIGVRLDEHPELLFTLRGVDHMELIAAGAREIMPKSEPGSRRIIAAGSMSEVFGIELGESDDLADVQADG